MSSGEATMTIPSLRHDAAPEAMTRRARWYLCVASFRHAAIGIFCIVAPGLFGNAAFIPILDFLPVWGWGIAMVVCAFLCGMAALLRSGDWARWAMVVSATITSVLAMGVTIGVMAVFVQWAHDLRDFPPSPITPILLWTLAAKDFIVCAQPVRSPFEAVARKLAAGG